MWFYVISILAIIGVFVWLHYFPPRTKGEIGEDNVQKVFKRYIKNNFGVEFKDVLLSDNGKTTQIDNILFTRKGIYVIEVKNYSGHIYGSHNSLNWTVTTKKTYRYRNGYQKSFYDKHQFYNPIRQNENHIKKLMNVYDTGKLPIFNIVVFGNQSVLKDVSVDNGVYVINQHQLWNLLEYLESNLSYKLSEEGVIMESNKLISKNIEGKDARTKHVNDIRRQFYR